MAIFREPLATKNFTQVPNHWLRDPRLTAKAKGVLAYIASHAPGYELTTVQIIAEMKDGESAVKSAIRELEKVGYLQRKQRRDENGRLSSTDYWIVESPDEAATVGRFSTGGKSASGETSGGSSAGGGSGTKNTNPKNTKEKNTMKGSEVECSPSGRFAPSGADDDTDNQPLTLEPTEPRTTGWNDWRTADYECFLTVLETEQVYSTGGKAGPEGHYPARALYDAMQRMPDGAKDWPGRYLEGVYARDPRNGIDSWLARYDLERA
jgi:hypothetical protein